MKNFECSKSKPATPVLFSVCQNYTWTIRCLVDETIDPVTQRIILKIVGFFVHCRNLYNIFMIPQLLYYD